MSRHKRPKRKEYEGPVDPTIAAIKTHDAEMSRIFRSLPIYPLNLTHGGYECPDKTTMERLIAAVNESKIINGESEQCVRLDDRGLPIGFQYWIRTWLSDSAAATVGLFP